MVGHEIRDFHPASHPAVQVPSRCGCNRQLRLDLFPTAEPATSRQIRYVWVLCTTLGIARKETEQIIAANKHDIDVMSRTLSIMEYDCERMDKLDKNTCGRREKSL